MDNRTFVWRFCFSNQKACSAKKDKKAASWFLYVHCLIHAILIYLLSPDKSLWIIPLIIFISHYCIDLWKLYQKENTLSFIIDQLLHLLVLLALWIIFYCPANWLPSFFLQLLNNYNAWLIGSAYLFVIFPLAYLLGYATQRWRKDIEQNKERSATSLSEAGKWIGIFERILVVTLLLSIILRE